MTDQPTIYVCLDCGTLGADGDYHDHGDGETGHPIALGDVPAFARDYERLQDDCADLKDSLRELRELVDAVLDSSGEEFYIAFGALHAERQARTVPVDTGTRHP